MARQLLEIEVSEVKGKRVGLMKLSFDNTAYRLWLQEIMKQFVLTVRPGTNHWYLSHSIV